MGITMMTVAAVSGVAALACYAPAQSPALPLGTTPAAD